MRQRTVTSAAGRDHEAVRSIPPAATHQFGVFTATQAHAAGWSRHGLEWAMQAGHLVRPRLDLSVEQGLDSGVVAADLALRHGLLTRRQLAAAAERLGRQDPRKVAVLADPLCESPLESISRLQFVRAGLTPELQILIRHRSRSPNWGWSCFAGLARSQPARRAVSATAPGAQRGPHAPAGRRLPGRPAGNAPPIPVNFVDPPVLEGKPSRKTKPWRAGRGNVRARSGRAAPCGSARLRA